jgi:potassium/chloride transporter 9
VTYVILILCFAGGFSRQTLLEDQNLFQNSSLGSRYIVVVGIIISALSSGLGSLFGGSRVLQAVARDNLFPILKPFKYGSANGDEPRVAVIFTYIIAQVRCTGGLAMGGGALNAVPCNARRA